MALPLDQQARPWTAVLALAAVLAGALAWSGMMLAGSNELHAEIESKNELLANLMSRSVTDRGAGSLVARIPAHLTAIAGTTETVAASELHKLLLEYTEEAGGSVQSVQSEATRDVTPDGMRRLSGQIAFEGSVTALQRVLVDLETNVPFIFVDSLSVQPSSAVAPGARAGDRLRVTLVVSGYWRSGRASAMNQ